jgi:geranylgeranyl pyrophosphate synthase
MTNSAFVLDPRTPLAELLDEQFEAPALDQLLGLDGESVPWSAWEDSLYGPLADFLSRPGKEFRARLVNIAWRLGGKRTPAPRELPLIVEALHAGSLIVDDIEDESAYRRGAPALHTTHGVPTALNAGCWLYFWPHALVDRLGLHPTVELEIRRLLSQTLLRAHQGQALDLSVCVHDLAPKDVGSVVAATTRLKTGALMQLAAQIGAVAAGARPEVSTALGRFGRELGVGLQMADDLGGLVSEKRCHKGHEDLIHARPTWPWAWLSRSLDSVGYARLVAFGREVSRRELHPELLAEELRARLEKPGRERVRQHLFVTLANLRGVAGDAPAFAEIEREIEDLEASYG